MGFSSKNKTVEKVLSGTGVSAKTLTKLIDKLGGEQKFKEYCHHQENGVRGKDGVSGLLFADDRTDFFFENRDDLLDFIQKQAISNGHESKTDYVLSALKKDRLIDRHLYSSDAVNAVLVRTHSESLENTQDDDSVFDNPVEVDVTSLIVWDFVDEVCKAYNKTP